MVNVFYVYFLHTELERNYTITLAIGPSQSDRTANLIWFQIEGTSTNWTEWFSQSGDNDRGINKTFWRNLTDVGNSTKVRVLMQINNNVGVTGVGVDDNYLGFGQVISIVYQDGMHPCFYCFPRNFLKLLLLFEGFLLMIVSCKLCTKPNHICIV